MSVIYVPKSLQDVIRVLKLADKEPVWKVEDLEDCTIVTLTWLKYSSDGDIPDSVDSDNTYSIDMKGAVSNGDEYDDRMEGFSGNDSEQGLETPPENESIHSGHSENMPFSDYIRDSTNKKRISGISKHFSKEDDTLPRDDIQYAEVDDKHVVGEITSSFGGQIAAGKNSKEDKIVNSKAYFTGLDDSSLPFSFKDDYDNDESSDGCSEPVNIVKKTTYSSGGAVNSFNFTYSDNENEDKEDNEKTRYNNDQLSSPELDERWFNAPSPEAVDYDGDEEHEIEVETSDKLFYDVGETSRKIDEPSNQGSLRYDGRSHPDEKSCPDYLRLQENKISESSVQGNKPRISSLDKFDVHQSESAESEVLTPTDSVVRDYVYRNNGATFAMNNRENVSTTDDLKTADSLTGGHVNRNKEVESRSSSRDVNGKYPQIKDRVQREISFAERFRGDVFPSDIVSSSSYYGTVSNGIIKCSCGESFTVREEAVRHILFSCPVNLCWRVDLDIRIHQEIKQWDKEEEKRVGRKWWQAFKTQGGENYRIILAEDKKVILKGMIDKCLKETPHRIIRRKDGTEEVQVEELGMTLCE